MQLCWCRRATRDMKATIETFLFLAREEETWSEHEPFLVKPLVQRALELQRELRNSKPIEVAIHEMASPRVQGHNEAFFIVVNNLIRNAFEHKLAGQEPISIHIKAHELVIINESKAASVAWKVAAKQTPQQA